jgi:hypothetical protein
MPTAPKPLTRTIIRAAGPTALLIAATVSAGFMGCYFREGVSISDRRAA